VQIYWGLYLSIHALATAPWWSSALRPEGIAQENCQILSRGSNVGFLTRAEYSAYPYSLSFLLHAPRVVDVDGSRGVNTFNELLNPEKS
jgi:hypothetical protein